ncbi:MAG: hypothetical protein ACU836_16630 [Gammaproteobacteria bacterium]
MSFASLDLLLGIDDTDNLESRGTGFRVRRLGKLLEQNRLALISGITRHQLFVSPLIPYTSHNSAACMGVMVAEERRDELIAFCRDYLFNECAVGSDAGLCVAEAAMVSTEIQQFGRRAKTEVLTQQQSRELASRHGFFLEGLTGDQGGVIGALAAVGLRAEGREGRFIGLRGIRDLAIEDYSLAQLQTQTDIEAVQTVDGEPVTDPEATITMGDWVRPVLFNGQATLLVEKQDGDEQNNHWRVAPKAVIKSH